MYFEIVHGAPQLQEPQVILGFTGILIATTLITAASAIAFAIIATRGQNGDALQPSSLDDFNVTQVKEGLAIRWLVGRRRVNTNIIDYRDLVTKEVKQKSGGKGGGGGSQVVGYKYFLSVWHGICRARFGAVTLVETYVQDRVETIEADDIVFNDGSTGVFPSWSPNSNRIKTFCHIAYERWFLGENVSSVPTVHLVVELIYSGTIGISNANLSNGANPAAAVYAILREAGVPDSRIDFPSFNAAASYWSGRGYGINLTFNQRGKAGQAIQKILQYVDGILHKNGAGKYVIRALDPADPIVFTIPQDDIEGLVVNRKGWRQVPNKFRATFIDETQDYTQRVVVAENPAAIRQAGYEINRSIDLTAFRDISTASKRLFEIMKRESYPGLVVKFTTNLKYSTLIPGDVIRIEYPDYSIAGADFRVTKVGQPGVNDNKISIEGRQLVETLFDDEFVVAGGSDWQNLAPIPMDLQEVRFFEAPFNDITLGDPAYIMLARREGGYETGYLAEVSDQPAQDFELFGEFTTFSLHGTLSIAYPDTTTDIDQEVGIQFTPSNNFEGFDTISRSQLFAVQRVVIIGDEVMAFQEVQPQGGGDLKLVGVIRGPNIGTPKQSHLVGADVWLTFISSNLLQRVRFEDFYVRLRPRFNADILDAASATSHNVVQANKAKQPRAVGRIVATRTGSTIDVQIWPSTPGVDGAGDNPESVTDQAPPFVFLGDFRVQYDAIDAVESTDSFSFTRAGGPFNLTISHRLNGFEGPTKVVVVGAADGDYKA